MTLRERLRLIIFGTETPLGKAFDVILLVVILLSVLAVCLETVESIQKEYAFELRAIEWGFTILFLIEYILRLWISRDPVRYARSFFGVVDLLSILPSFVALLIPGSHALLVIRGLRMVRLFRILKLSRYVGESEILLAAMRASRPKITVFLVGVLTAIVIVGALMYLIEGPEHGFTSIPQSIYWAVVTLTTVGYGDIAPETTLGKMLASCVMILGYGVLAVPTGIVTAEITQASRGGRSRCESCGAVGHAPIANYCHICGGELLRV